MLRFFGFVVLLFGAIIIAAVYKDIMPFVTNDKPGMIYSLWKQDIEKLIVTKKLPKEFGQIEKIEYNPLSENTKALLQKINAPIKTNPKGNFTLQITLDDWKDDKGHGYMIQYNLMDSSTKNNIWELGRTLTQ